MMRPKTINDGRLLELIDIKKLSQTAAAEKLGVTRQAVSQRLRELKGRTTRIVVAKETQKLVKKGFDAISQLSTINEKTIKLLDQAEEDPKLALKCIAEIRNQVKLAMEIQDRIFDQQEAERFMLLVIETLREVSPDAFKEFKMRINEHTSLTKVLKFN